MVRSRKDSITSIEESPQNTNEVEISDDSDSSRSPSPEPPLPPIVFHLYIQKNGKWVRGYSQGTVVLDNPFDDIKQEFIDRVIDKLDTTLADLDQYNITFATKWATTNTRTSSTAKKSTAPVNPDDFADFRRSSCLAALVQTIRGTLKKVRGKLDAGNKQLLVLASITGIERIRIPANDTFTFDDDEVQVADDELDENLNRQVCSIKHR